MGRGRNRKPRNFATFRLCPRPGAADASDRVFVRVDDNPYSVPGFADDGAGSSSSSGAGAGGAEGEAPSTEDGGGPLPDHVRREILELGLPDDGYDYLAHLRELRPSLSSTGGGGASAVFLPSRCRPARSGLPLDVKTYDLTGDPVGSGKVVETAVATRWVETAIDVDVAKLLEESDLPAPGSGDEDLEEDFVVIASQPDVEYRAERLPREQFDSLLLEGYAGVEDAECVRDVKHALSQEVIVDDQLLHGDNCDADEKRRILESSIKEKIGESSNILECTGAGYAESYLYESSKEEQMVLISANAKKELLKIPTGGETSLKKVIIKKGVEKLPVEYLPQRRTSSGLTSKQGPYKETKEDVKEV